MTRLEQDRAAALEASRVSQAKAKRENAAHTPGPWAAGRKTISGLNHRVYAKDAILIADCDGQQGYASALADARLIAASPDLLHALIMMLDAYEIPSVRAMARAAIAKAIGEQP